LSEVFGVVLGTRKPITNVIDTPVVRADNLLPCGSVAAKATLDERSCELTLFCG
jgi:hypothetical protein